MQLTMLMFGLVGRSEKRIKLTENVFFMPVARKAKKRTSYLFDAETMK